MPGPHGVRPQERLHAASAVRGVDLAVRHVAGRDAACAGYDVLTLPGRRLAILVAGAALRAAALAAAAPADAVERADRLAAARGATLLAIVLDPATGEATACSAGHPPPLLIDAAGARVAEVAPGAVVGAAEGSGRAAEPGGPGFGPRRPVRLDVASGATLVAYAHAPGDGLAPDAALARLREAAADGADVGALPLVERMIAGRRVGDELAVVAVGRGGSSIARSFAALPAAVAAARHQVTAFAAAHGVGELVLRDIALAVSEACTNVVVHAYRNRAPGPLHLTARHRDGALEVTIVDEGGGVRPRGDSPGVGLGLQIIARTTERFDVRDAEGGDAELVLRFRA